MDGIWDGQVEKDKENRIDGKGYMELKGERDM